MCANTMRTHECTLGTPLWINSRVEDGKKQVKSLVTLMRMEGRLASVIINPKLGDIMGSSGVTRGSAVLHLCTHPTKHYQPPHKNDRSRLRFSVRVKRFVLPHRNDIRIKLLRFLTNFSHKAFETPRFVTENEVQCHLHFWEWGKSRCVHPLVNKITSVLTVYFQIQIEGSLYWCFFEPLRRFYFQVYVPSPAMEDFFFINFSIFWLFDCGTLCPHVGLKVSPNCKTHSRIFYFVVFFG